MYSMHYIDKFIKNFREFYNEINGATLTGAIDVVVVEQPDGSFTCSPFHVRFGKLGVLRSNFKVVDLELNGEPLQIHMKLGESGEAFFVEEVGEDEAECSAHLATSPIPAARFEERYEPRRRNSLSAVEPDHGQASDYTKRRYTADGQTMQKPDPSKLKKNATVDHTNNDNDALFEMEGLDEGGPDGTDGRPRTFAAAQLGEVGSEAHQAVQKISAHNDFRPIDAAPTIQDDKTNGNGKKKKKTRKVSSKKKHQRKSSTSSISSQSDRAGSEQRPTQTASLQTANDLNFFSDGEVASAALSDEMSNMNLGGEHRIPLALSDTAFEVHAGGIARNASMYVTGGSRGGTPVQSDTEVELGRAGAAAGDKSSQSWRWGELPEPPPRDNSASAHAASPIESPEPASPAEPASPTEPLSSDEERPSGRGVLSGMFRLISKEHAPEQGVYLDDIDKGAVDPNLYLSTYHTERYHKGPSTNINVTSGPTEEEYESGNGPSLPQSPASLEPQIDSDDDDKILAKGQVGVYVREEMVTRAVPFEEFCQRGGALAADGRLVVRLGDRWLPWRSAGPQLLSLLAYRRRLPTRVLEDLEKGGTDKEGSQPQQRASENGAKSRGYSWWGWRRSNADSTKRSEPQTKSESLDSALPPTQIETATELHATPAEETPADIQQEATVALEAVDDKDDNVFEDDIVTRDTVDSEDVPEIVIDNKPSQEQERQDHSSSDSEHDTGRPTRRFSSFRKTLRLSSEQIKNLNLREGMNEMVFSVTTAYQGTTRCKCNVFRWRHDDKIVISDIDGTITKSDVLGHIFPLVGKDWAQSGVAQLFTKIKNNGYQLLYLSARAIGQARVTREYLRSIKQGELSLPDGPLLLNPTSLLRAFHREVIEKKPEEFKISCLADIKALFPPGSSPFYAGYGNRVNDVWSYQAVGIPIVRIFTINYKGELKHELTQTFQSTYHVQSDMVDDFFPASKSDNSDNKNELAFS